MSALSGHIKALQALADAFWDDGAKLAALDPQGGQFLQYMASGFRGAAEALEAQAVEECSGEDHRGEKPLGRKR